MYVLRSLDGWRYFQLDVEATQMTTNSIQQARRFATTQEARQVRGAWETVSVQIEHGKVRSINALDRC